MADRGLDAVIFDWGGTLSDFVALELLDVWRAAARHLDPAREEELTAALLAVEERFWARTTTTQESGTLADLLAEASRDLGLDVAEAVLEEAAVHHLDSWTPHIAHDADAVPGGRGPSPWALCRPPTARAPSAGFPPPGPAGSS